MASGYFQLGLFGPCFNPSFDFKADSNPFSLGFDLRINFVKAGYCSVLESFLQVHLFAEAFID
jgi:hypothetical protein